MNKEQLKVFYNKTKHIDGWFSLEAALLINAIDAFQKSIDVRGNVFEIGVHHGKSSVLFANLLASGEQLNICDVFDSQEDNVSSSGKGSRSIFLENIKKYSNTEITTIHTCLSSELSPDKIGQQYRLFHIDGGHNTDEALFDLILASKTLHEKGIIILDDPFRIEWPGVTEALLEFLKQNEDFEAIVVGFNKLLVCKKAVAKLYIDFIDNIDTRDRVGLGYPYSYKKLPFAGSELRIFYVLSSMNANGLKEVVTKTIFDSKIYKWYKGKK